VNVSVARGAKLMTGGQRPKLTGDLAGGNFY
jgi:hypothetical protein